MMMTCDNCGREGVETVGGPAPGKGVVLCGRCRTFLGQYMGEDMAVHKLKTTYTFFYDIWYKDKRFEVRNNEDRNFQVGDWAILRETARDGYTGRDVWARITYVLSDRQFPDGIKPGYCVFGFEVISSHG